MTDAGDDTVERQREAMLREIAAEAAATARYTGRPAFDPRVMAALGRVPRHEFVPAAEGPFAYVNGPLPIGHGQTISQPYIVALMSDLLRVEPHHVVLEVGTGCGYQAAVLAELALRVYSIEVIPELAKEAAVRLRRLGYDNVEVRAADGYAGWPEHAPYDGIVVTAAAPEVPPPLVAQLKAGGRLVIPVGTGYLGQDLMVLDKTAAGETEARSILPVAFVPLRRREPR
ncbi:MAG TPA: protein-L-isoaspartate(D-aspartate) O-methyltransferase [Dongiaceae bacterium]|nr:protein-L-isoaspartate(D-aspartate) O-methyltransferase [Dongiaceae bacterium]